MVVVRPPSIVHRVSSFKITGKWCRMTGKETRINPMEKEINKMAEKKSELYEEGIWVCEICTLLLS